MVSFLTSSSLAAFAVYTRGAPVVVGAVLASGANVARIARASICALKLAKPSEVDMASMHSCVTIQSLGMISLPVDGWCVGSVLSVSMVCCGFAESVGELLWSGACGVVGGGIAPCVCGVGSGGCGGGVASSCVC